MSIRNDLLEGITPPQGLYEGTRAITCQSYPEANIKNGLQFFLRATWPDSDSIASGTSRYIHLTTGAKYTLVEFREIQYIANEVKIETFANPTGVTGGTSIPIGNYNSDPAVAQASLANATKNVSVTTEGILFGSEPEYFFGGTNQRNQSAGAIPQGRLRVVPPNSEFLIKITNTGSGVARVTYYIDWYEGAPDLPVA